MNFPTKARHLKKSLGCLPVDSSWWKHVCVFINLSILVVHGFCFGNSWEMVNIVILFVKHRAGKLCNPQGVLICNINLHSVPKSGFAEAYSSEWCINGFLASFLRMWGKVTRCSMQRETFAAGICILPIQLFQSLVSLQTRSNQWLIEPWLLCIYIRESC